MSGPTTFKTRQRQANWDKDENGQSMSAEIEDLKRMMSLRDVQIFEMKRTFPSVGSLKKKIRQLVGDTHIARHELQQSMGEVSQLTTELQELKNSRTPLTYEAHVEELEKLQSHREERARVLAEKRQMSDALYSLKAAQLDRSASNSSSAAAETSSGFDAPPAAITEPPSFGAIPSSHSVHSSTTPVDSTNTPGAVNGSQPTNATSSTGRVPLMNGATSSFNVTELGHGNGKLIDVSGTTLKFGKKNEDAREFSSSAKTLPLQTLQALEQDVGQGTVGVLVEQHTTASTTPLDTGAPDAASGVLVEQHTVSTHAGGLFSTHSPTPTTPTPSYHHQNSMITTITGTPGRELVEDPRQAKSIVVTPSSKSSSRANGGQEKEHNSHNSRDSAVHLNLQTGGVSIASTGTPNDVESAFIVTEADGQDSSPQRQRKTQHRLYSSLHSIEVEKQIRTSGSRQYQSVGDCAMSLMPNIERKLHAHYQEMMQAEQQQTAHAPFNTMHSPLLNPQLNPQPNFSFFPTANPFPMFQQ